MIHLRKCADSSFTVHPPSPSPLAGSSSPRNPRAWPARGTTRRTPHPHACRHALRSCVLPCPPKCPECQSRMLAKNRLSWGGGCFLQRHRRECRLFSTSLRSMVGVRLDKSVPEPWHVCTLVGISYQSFTLNDTSSSFWSRHDSNPTPRVSRCEATSRLRPHPIWHRGHRGKSI
jgi:hypothetical protein